MKRIQFNVIFIAALVLIGLLAALQNACAQTIRIANNNPGATPGTNVYTGGTALQDAIAAAVSGDIIHVVPSSVNYGGITITDKKLTVLGIGLNSQKQIGQKSLVDNITINESGSSGTRISGLHFGDLLMLSVGTSIVLSNILIDNCQLEVVRGPFGSGNSIGNLIVRNCIINSSNSTFNPQAFELFTTSGVIITNNIIQGNCCSSGAISGDGLTVTNNLFYYNNSGHVFQDIDNATIQNNIFYGTSPAMNANCTGNTLRNNLVFSSGDDTFVTGPNTDGGGNVVADPLITNLPFVTSNWVYSYDITLLAGSPALGAGADATDIGPSGGATPFDYEGTFLPLIQEINMPAVVTQGNDLEVNIKAKGN